MGLGPLNPGCNCCGALPCDGCATIQFSDDFGLDGSGTGTGILSGLSASWEEFVCPGMLITPGGYKLIGNGELMSVSNNRLARASVINDAPGSGTARFTCRSLECNVRGLDNFATMGIWIELGPYFLLRSDGLFIAGMTSYGGCAIPGGTFGYTPLREGHMMIREERDIVTNVFSVWLCWNGEVVGYEPYGHTEITPPEANLRFGIQHTAITAGIADVRFNNLILKAH